VIRHLYKRPLETLLATFGISIALQQILKNVFCNQARPLTSPAWLDGAWVLNDVVSISYIRIAIFVLALVFLGFFSIGFVGSVSFLLRNCTIFYLSAFINLRPKFFPFY
jgi:branched-subunit amino acid ABC-type transport system permease component